MDVRGGQPSVDTPRRHRLDLICNFLSINTLRSNGGASIVTLPTASSGSRCRVREANRPGNGGLRTELNPRERLSQFGTGSRTHQFAGIRAPPTLRPAVPAVGKVTIKAVRPLRAVVQVSPSVYFSGRIFMTPIYLGANVPCGLNESPLIRTKECGGCCPPGADRERRVDCAANGLRSFRNHHDVARECWISAMI